MVAWRPEWSHGLGSPAMPIHIRAEPGEYAEACLLPGDPLRAKYIAETFFDVQAALDAAAICNDSVTGGNMAAWF
jgi:hypothetical protein